MVYRDCRFWSSCCRGQRLLSELLREGFSMGLEASFLLAQVPKSGSYSVNCTDAASPIKTVNINVIVWCLFSVVLELLPAS